MDLNILGRPLLVPSDGPDEAAIKAGFIPVTEALTFTLTSGLVKSKVSVCVRNSHGLRNLYGKCYLQAKNMPMPSRIAGVYARDGELYAVVDGTIQHDSARLIAKFKAYKLRKINSGFLDSLTAIGTGLLGAFGANIVDDGLYTPGELVNYCIVKNKKALLALANDRSWLDDAEVLVGV